MKLWITALLLLATGSFWLTPSSVHGQAHNEYPFYNSEDLLADASLFTPWSQAVQRHSSQREQLLACLNPSQSSEQACKGRLRTFNRAMTKAKELSTDDQIELVNFYINRSNYKDDRRQRIYDEHGETVEIIRNHWTTLYDFLRKGGDCEDYATSKYFMLRELGFEADNLRVVVTYERQLRGKHAVLAVRRSDGSIWLLDSDNSVKKRSHTGYRYIYAMNENAVWDHRPDYQGADLTGN